MYFYHPRPALPFILRFHPTSYYIQGALYLLPSGWSALPFIPRFYPSLNICRGFCMLPSVRSMLPFNPRFHPSYLLYAGGFVFAPFWLIRSSALLFFVGEQFFWLPSITNYFSIFPLQPFQIFPFLLFSCFYWLFILFHILLSFPFVGLEKVFWTGKVLLTSVKQRFQTPGWSSERAISMEGTFAAVPERELALLSKSKGVTFFNIFIQLFTLRT